jgi:hypothetical protein
VLKALGALSLIADVRDDSSVRSDSVRRLTAQLRSNIGRLRVPDAHTLGAIIEAAKNPGKNDKGSAQSRNSNRLKRYIAERSVDAETSKTWNASSTVSPNRSLATPIPLRTTKAKVVKAVARETK